MAQRERIYSSRGGECAEINQSIISVVSAQKSITTVITIKSGAAAKRKSLESRQTSSRIFIPTYGRMRLEVLHWRGILEDTLLHFLHFKGVHLSIIWFHTGSLQKAQHHTLPNHRGTMFFFSIYCVFHMGHLCQPDVKCTNITDLIFHFQLHLCAPKIAH